MKILHRVLLGILAALSVLIVGFIIRLNQTPKNLPPLIPISTPTPHPKITCKRFTDIAVALKNIEIACVLDLSGQNLTSLSPDVKRLTKLNEIDLQDNKLTSLPKELFETKKLVRIDVRNNQITSFPEDIEIQGQVQELLITNNLISAESLHEKFPEAHIQ